MDLNMCDLTSCESDQITAKAFSAHSVQKTSNAHQLLLTSGRGRLDGAFGAE